ncbi:AMP-binding protein [Kitasatospora sp. NBC_01287]|uniref:AMP-binding protein n=1 Tax=Kitasatospora sp. NBC_01287 TaxID=2903573 RepID=UPI00225ABEF2|nr:AMP-binding protein [Kitasatospora sp. NBC_01287]MCX4745631.1 AMP-binding protein [Kitasatospora sp. NBC_01287]
MRAVEEALSRHAESERPLVRVLDEHGATVARHSYREVTRAARALADRITDRITDRLAGCLADRLTERLAARRTVTDVPSDMDGRSRVGVLCGNTPEFVVADLALLTARATEIPVPLAFSREQAAGLLESADLCLVDEQGAARLAEWGPSVLPAGCQVVAVTLDGGSTPWAPAAATGPGPGLDQAEAEAEGQVEDQAEDWICKIIHTSGTTSRPKGVRIRAQGIGALIDSLHTAMPDQAFRAYLSLVPFSLLIEQVTGLYLVLLDGGCVTLLPPDSALVGTSAGAVASALPQLAAARPTAVVATPALAAALADAAGQAERAGLPVSQVLFGTERPPLICCGGAPVHPATLRELDRHGIAVHEGYGLSENSSVVSWNTPGARRIGTVGRPLAHVTVKLAEDGELLVRSSSLFAGYTRPDPSSCAVVDGWLHTGDLAGIDPDGYLTITGRKKNIIITAAGRNIAPEWVEAQYARLPFVRAVGVVGNDLPALHGLFVIAPDADPGAAAEAIAAFGAEHLSAVERVEVLHLLRAEQDGYRRYFTVTGRPVRAAITADLDRLPTTGAKSTATTTESGTTESATAESSTTESATIESAEAKGTAMATTTPDVRPYGTGTGKLLQPAPGVTTLRDLDPRAVIELLAEAGFLVLRGFAPSIEDFSLFVKEHSDRVTLDPARSFHGGDVAQKVDAGTAELGLHIENGNSPFIPDLTWFLCERAAASGSQTTVCDGYRVWDAAAEADRAAFAQDIVYARRVEEAKWKQFVVHQSGGVKTVAEVTFADFQQLAAIGGPGTTVTELPDGSVHYAFRTPAARTTLFGARLAWANSIFGPSYNYEKPTITFADGTALPEELTDRLAWLTEELTEELDWQDGDVVLVDNTRVMHGRRAITDPNRTIYNAQSYLRGELLPGSRTAA